MPFNSISDYITKYEQGNWWSSYYIREITTPLAASTVSNRWIDYSGEGTGTPPNLYLSGNPLTATPIINSGNSLGLYTGPVPAAGQTKHLHSMFIQPGGSVNMPSYLPMSFILCDYLMYYPGIDLGLSTQSGNRVQYFDNTQTLPRYTDGDGVMAFMVMQNMPSLSFQSGSFVMSYIDSAGNSVVRETNSSTNQTEIITMSGQITTSKYILNGSSLNFSSGLTPNSITPFIPLNTGSRGIRRITGITFGSSTIGGTAAIILCRPIAQITILAPTSTAGTANALCGTEKIFKTNLPRIEDGACLHFLGTFAAGTGSYIDFRCNLTFVWG